MVIRRAYWLISALVLMAVWAGGDVGVTVIRELLSTFLGPGRVWIVARVDIDDGLRGAQVKALARGVESGLKRKTQDIYRVDVVPIGAAQARNGWPYHGLRRLPALWMAGYRNCSRRGDPGGGRLIGRHRIGRRLARHTQMLSHRRTSWQLRSISGLRLRDCVGDQLVAPGNQRRSATSGLTAGARARIGPFHATFRECPR